MVEAAAGGDIPGKSQGWEWEQDAMVLPPTLRLEVSAGSRRRTELGGRVQGVDGIRAIWIQVVGTGCE